MCEYDHKRRFLRNEIVKSLLKTEKPCSRSVLMSWSFLWTSTPLGGSVVTGHGEQDSQFAIFKAADHLNCSLTNCLLSKTLVDVDWHPINFTYCFTHTRLVATSDADELDELPSVNSSSCYCRLQTITIIADSSSSLIFPCALYHCVLLYNPRVLLFF